MSTTIAVIIFVIDPMPKRVAAMAGARNSQLAKP
jgi:hypothetical protein